MSDRLEAYVERYFQRHDCERFPTVRRCATSLRMKQQEVWEAAEDNDNLMLTSMFVQGGEPLGNHFVETVNEP